MAESKEGNRSVRSYSRSDPWSFPSISLSVRSFRPGSLRVGLFGTILVGRFGPFNFIWFLGNKRFFWLARLILYSFHR